MSLNNKSASCVMHMPRSTKRSDTYITWTKVVLPFIVAVILLSFYWFWLLLASLSRFVQFVRHNTIKTSKMAAVRNVVTLSLQTKSASSIKQSGTISQDCPWSALLAEFFFHSLRDLLLAFTYGTYRNLSAAMPRNASLGKYNILKPRTVLIQYIKHDVSF